MTDEADVTEPWAGDVNEAAIEDWKQESTAFDRITTVIDTTTQPAFASAIAERAAVSEPTARRHLQSLADVGRVTAVSANGGTKYKRSPNTLAMRRIAGLHAHYSKSGLQNAIIELRDELTAFRDKHGVSDADDLATERTPGADHWTDVSRMRDLETNLDIAKAALHLYDFDPDDQHRQANGTDQNDGEPSDQSAVGSLAGFDSHDAA